MPTRTILHPKLGDYAIKDFHSIPTSICSRTQAKKAISRQPICLTDAEYDHILEEIVRRKELSLKEKLMCIVMIWRIDEINLNKYYMY